MKKIGLTGVIGAGKSTLINILKEKDIRILDCDAINADLLQKDHEGYHELLALFGRDILHKDEEINKEYLSEIIFKDTNKKAMVEAVLHPLIQKEIESMMKLHSREEMIVVEVPLLFEIHWEKFFDEIWVITSDEDILIQRLITHRGISEKEVRQRLATQIPQAIKIQKADVVFYNNGDIENLKRQIYDILDTL